MYSNEFKIHEIKNYYFVKKIKNNEIHKQILLPLFNKQIKSNRQFGLNSKNQNVCIDSIYNYDYQNSKNFNRQWVIYIKKYIDDEINDLTNILPYRKPNITSIWFQQYMNNDKHSWHLHHGSTYSGVYYLECDKTMTTEYVDMINTKEKNRFIAEEGDLVIFPSMLLHQSPLNITNQNKTIISFNFDFTDNIIID